MPDSGIASYSFSTSESNYDWQSTNTFTATSAGTYYIAVKDAAGNISDITYKTLRNSPVFSVDLEYTGKNQGKGNIKAVVTGNERFTIPGWDCHKNKFECSKQYSVKNSPYSETVIATSASGQEVTLTVEIKKGKN